ncbi:uncharacterized protein MYCFIDRAFT_205158 [Pseudocercospora fijiensis CIRAD86]|uniref:Acetyl-CoA synthetase-like protein n=1 Tax=Pseudocercospora fijiensis (strain CIRAD86) TaxID=383855 RepID=M2YM08_PSEFD|nr:uncharacterized protein MYCFIDRAFT_205158 [Pseudocercospora fijiensis CIRAD86]EME78745.1 hypothetical protein MYCFIDRAFT_205158 [Pseudocercospora fijiensis CIRAD86]
MQITTPQMGSCTIPTKDILSYYFDDPQYDLDNPLYIDAEEPERYYTGRQCKKAIRQLAAGFKAIGLVEGDCVCVHSFNNLDYPVLVNGIAGFGGVYTGSNPAYQPFELAHHFRAAKVQAVIAEPDLLLHVAAAAKQTGIPTERIFVFDKRGQKAYQSWERLFNHGESDWPRFDDLETAKNTTLARLFSSGTTGLPKAAVLSHHAQHRLFCEWNPTPWQSKRLAILPPCEETFVAKRFDLETYLRLVERHQITEGAFVPPMVTAIINSPLSKKYSLKSIRLAHGGAAPLDAWQQARPKELLHPDCPFTQVWGMTETCCTASMTPWPHDEPTGSVGQLLPNMDAKLVDDDGNDITAFDVRGELCVRGPIVIQGYFENPQANARDWDTDGYFHTGDIAYRDGKTTRWYIVDRKKELIKVRGFQVAPAELEAVLYEHPKISDVGIIGIPVEGVDGELPRAYVVLKAGCEDLTKEDVKACVAERLAKHKRLDGGVVFLQELPKTASGKKLERTLREWAANEVTDGSRAKL